MNKLTIQDLDLRGKRVFIRVDFNVPLKDGVVTDDTRIRETLPTLRLAIQKGGRLVLASHLGRPKGGPEPKYSLLPAAKKLEQLIERPVRFASDCVGPIPESKSRSLAEGDILLLENVALPSRRREKRRSVFQATCGALRRCIRLRCFRLGAPRARFRRGHHEIREAGSGGAADGKELEYIGKAISDPARPFVAILGGAKVSDKIEVVENLMKIADAMLIGGGMAYTFLKAQGLPIGKSLVEEDKIELAKKIPCRCTSKNFKFLLPSDNVIAPEFKADSPATIAGCCRDAAEPDGSGHRLENDRGRTRRKSRNPRPSYGTSPMGVF